MPKYSRAADEAMAYALSKGFTLVRDRRHIIMRRGNRTVSFAKTPSDPRALLNIKRDIDRTVKELEMHELKGKELGSAEHKQPQRNGAG